MNIDWVARAQASTFSLRNFIDGRWVAGSSESYIEKHSPRNGELAGRFCAAGAADVDAAVASARRAFEDGRWSGMPLSERKRILQRFATLIDSQREELALLDCMDVGKPVMDALNMDVPSAANLIRYNAEAADKVSAKVYGADQTSLSYQLRRPVGVVAALVGWNFPLLLAATKIGPVLATGNCLVLKPSELTGRSAAKLAELAMEAGIPEGVLNVIHGDAAVGQGLAHHAGVDLITFTGSTATGKKLLVASGQSNMKRLILECGGKAPNIVFDDCPDLEAVAEASIAGAFWNQGQVCAASSRLLVQEKIKDELLSRIISKTSTRRHGDPLDSKTDCGPVVSRDHQRKILDYIDSGKREGAKVAFQSSSASPFEKGFYVPTVIFDRVSTEYRIAQEEIFGPVLSVLAFKDEAEAVRIANGTVYGLSATLWTKDLGRAHRVTQALQAGWVVVNATGTPRGGPVDGSLTIGGHKQSGMGGEGGLEGLEAYMSQTAVQLFV